MTEMKKLTFIENAVATVLVGAFCSLVLTGASAAAFSVLGADEVARVCGAAAAFCGVMFCGAFVAGLVVFNSKAKSE